MTKVIISVSAKTRKSSSNPLSATASLRNRTETEIANRTGKGLKLDKNGKPIIIPQSVAEQHELEAIHQDKLFKAAHNLGQHEKAAYHFKLSNEHGMKALRARRAERAKR